MLLMAARGRQRQVDLCEFKDSLVYTESSLVAKATRRKPVSKKNKTKQKQKPKKKNLWQIKYLVVKY